jgi:hypothetical protein
MLMNTRLFLIGARLFFAALNVAAIVAQLLYSSQYGIGFSLLNFFSFFTILSNVFVTIVFVISAFYLAIGRKPSPSEDVLRGASVLYMAVTGIIYATLLSGIDVDLTLPWVNLQLHYIMPIVVVADWLYQPQRATLSIKKITPWLLFPALYLVYSLIRGPIVNWYPYPFLNPASAGGYGGVALYSVGILGVLFVVSFVLMKLGNALKRHAA